jgi:hypothetical protein
MKIEIERELSKYNLLENNENENVNIHTLWKILQQEEDKTRKEYITAFNNIKKEEKKILITKEEKKKIDCLLNVSGHIRKIKTLLLQDYNNSCY